MKRGSLLIAVVLSLGCASASAGPASPGAAAKVAPKGPAPAVLGLPRPKGGEWLGLYILGKKAGYAFMDFEDGAHEGKPAIHTVSEVSINANVGGAETHRSIHDERWYERKDGGRLLAFRIEHKGDGGEETLVGACTPEGIHITRKRPNVPDEERKLPPTQERVEEADAPRWVMKTGEKRNGVTLDAEETLTDKKQLTEVASEGSVVLAGLSIPVTKVRTTEEKSNIPVEITFARDGRTLEVNFGQVMVGKAEDEKLARQLDKVDLFALTRVVLDKKLPEAIRTAPAELTLKITGMPKAFRTDSTRQKFTDLDGGEATRMVITARIPGPSKKRPIAAEGNEELAEALKSTLAIESDSKVISDMAHKVVAGETDALAAAWKLTSHVYGFLEKSYGTSSDRATDVVARKKGDCTEHALLLTSLARAVGIPARRVDGLVYMDSGDGVPALYWHEWAEVWTGEWVAVDPTFNQPVADPTHLALGGEGRSDAAGLIGQLKMAVLEVKTSAKKTEKAKESPQQEGKAVPGDKAKADPKQ